MSGEFVSPGASSVRQESLHYYIYGHARSSRINESQRVMFFLLLGFLFVFIITACGNENDDMKTISLTENENGSRLEVPTGSSIEISLPENPTTGYRWAIYRLDEGILTAGEQEYTLNEGSGFGGGGVRRFTFSSIGNGETSLALKNWRDWEGEDSVIDRFQVTIVVK